MNYSGTVMAPRPLGKMPYRVAIAAMSWLLVLAAGVFGPAIWGGESFGDRDLGFYYHPAKSLIAPLARASLGIPHWNPFFASGQPFAANPEHALFHPLTALFFLLPFELAFRLQVMVPVLASVGTMFLLLRALERRRFAAIFAGLAWGFGGYLLSTTNLLPILFAASILPLTLTFVVRLIRKPRAAHVAALALSVGVQCLAGEPSTLVMTPLLCAAAALAMWRRRARLGPVAVVAGLFLGLAVGAVTLVPGAHHARKTVRAEGLERASAGEWSMPPVRVLDLLSPNVLGHVEPGNEQSYWGRSLYARRESPFFFSLYPGLAVTLLAFAAWRHRFRALVPWIAVASLGVLLALGDHFVLWRILRVLPVFASIRFPEKYALLFILPVVVGSAYGFEHVVMGTRKARRGLVRVLAGLATMSVVGAASIALFAPRWSADFPWRVASVDALRMAGISAALLVVLWPHLGWGRTTRALAVCSLLALDLVIAGRGVVHTTPVHTLSTPPTSFVPLLNRRADDLVYHAAEWHPTMGKVEGAGKPPLPAQWGLAMTLENDFDLTFLRWTDEGARAFRQVITSDPALAKPLLERRGVTAVVQFRAGTHWQDGAVIGPTGQSPIEVVFLRGSQPIVFAATRVETVQGVQGVEGWMAAVRRLRDQAGNSACVEASSLSSFPGQPSPAEVTVRSRTPDSIALEVEAKGPNLSFLAFNQTWDEGWRLTIDDVPASLLRTEVSLSGFVVPPGRHRVAMVYQDRWVDAGLAVSIVGVLGCLALVLSGRRRRRTWSTGLADQPLPR